MLVIVPFYFLLWFGLRSIVFTSRILRIYLKKKSLVSKLLISSGSLFHNLGAQPENVLSPAYVTVFVLGICGRFNQC